MGFDTLKKHRKLIGVKGIDKILKHCWDNWRECEHLYPLCPKKKCKFYIKIMTKKEDSGVKKQGDGENGRP